MVKIEKDKILLSKGTDLKKEKFLCYPLTYYSQMLRNFGLNDAQTSV